MRIEKFNAGRIEEFIDSEQYRTMPVIPVSPHRALSWLRNPRMDPQDILMYLLFDGSDLAAYRCILPDRHSDIRFGWLSGNWVDPARRRQGLASRLFDEAFRDWGHQLMYTNYAPESKAVYDKTGRFALYLEKEGARYYQRAESAKLLGHRNAVTRLARPLLRMADGIINAWQDVRISALQQKTKHDFPHAEAVTSVDPTSIDLMQRNHRLGFGMRDLASFDWITSHPWVVEGENLDDRYFFTWVVPRYMNTCLKIRNEQDRLVGFLMLSVVGEKMSVPYACFSEEAAADVCRILEHYLLAERISYITTYNPEVMSLMEKSRTPFLWKHRMYQKFFATEELISQLPEAKQIFFQDGDGDVVFT
jgi:GNAT superfamily N-acetyltransferase